MSGYCSLGSATCLSSALHAMRAFCSSAPAGERALRVSRIAVSKDFAKSAGGGGLGYVSDCICLRPKPFDQFCGNTFLPTSNSPDHLRLCLPLNMWQPNVCCPLHHQRMEASAEAAPKHLYELPRQWKRPATRHAEHDDPHLEGFQQWCTLHHFFDKRFGSLRKPP